MKELVTADGMRQIEKYAMEKLQLSDAILMERAALFSAAVLEKELKKRGRKKHARILVLCGVGNNGGDGLALARILYEHGYRVFVVLLGDRKKQTELNKKQQQILESLQIKIGDTIRTDIEYDGIVDAMLGIGITRGLSGTFAEAVETVNQMDAFKLAIDIPTGIHADLGLCQTVAFQADATAAFGCIKTGLLLAEGRYASGRKYLGSCGMPYPAGQSGQMIYFMPEKKDIRKALRRQPGGNKGTFGKLAVIAGSEKTPGAALLCTKAAFATGCGYIRLMTAEENKKLVLSVPEVVFQPRQEEEIVPMLQFASCLAIGPGIGTSEETKLFLQAVLRELVKSGKQLPVVLDADALNLFAADESLWKLTAESGAAVICTPHMAEFARLAHVTVEQIRENRLQLAGQFAQEKNCILVLKDATTVVAAPDGRICILPVGNDGMAVAGSGDVLTGTIAGIASRLTDSFLAACCAVYLHGLSGEKAARKKGNAAMLPTDLISHLGKVLKHIDQKRDW